MQIASNKQKITKLLLQIVLSLVFAICLICISKPIQAQADEGGEGNVQWIVDGEGTEYVYVPGQIYWGGSYSRTGILFYCVDAKSGAIIGNTKNILYNKKIDENGSNWMNEITSTAGNTRVGNYSIANVRPKYCSELPTTGAWDSDGGSPVKDWLEADSGITTPNGKPICNAARLVLLYVHGDAYQKVLNKEYLVCFEGMYGMAMYINKDGKDVARCHGKSVVQHKYPDATEEELAQYSIIKYFSTLRSYVEIASGFGIDITQRNGASGTANYKWIQSCAKYFSTTEEHFGVPAASKAGGDVTNGEMRSTGWNFAVIEVSLPPIHTYWKSNGTPGNTEPPNPEEGTDGKCTIKKLYYTQVLNPDGTVETEAKDYHSYTQKSTTNYISIDSEGNGYEIEGWKSSTSNKSFTKKATFKSISAIQSGTSSEVIKIQSTSDSEKYLYILYKKTEIRHRASKRRKTHRHVDLNNLERV